MIARRIVTALLFVIFFLVLEWNQNTVWGWVLLILLTAGFTVLFETGALKNSGLLKTLVWLLYIGGFVGILLLTWPPEKRVPAVTYRDPAVTAIREVSGGKVTGVLTEDGAVEIYAGIPYAAPPTGELRWKAPQDPAPWEGVLHADTFAPMCMQPRNPPIYYSLAQIIGYHDYKWFNLQDNYRPAVSEDGLYVNVWKPAGEKKDLQVLVFIHGGSLQTGQPWYADYSGVNLAREDVVVVNMGYRLGVFGYLGLKALQDESPEGTTGNYGLLDQVKALQWVRDNIAAFGGDPENVTVAGESAGSAAVSALLASPLAKDLFKYAVLESSTVASVKPPHSFRLLPDAFKSGEALMARLGVSGLDELRALPAEKLVGAASTEHHMTVDGYALTETPYETHKKGVFNAEAILHGYNSEESAPFILFGHASMKNYESRVRAYFGNEADAVLAAYPASTDAEADEYWAEIYGAVLFDYSHYCLNRLAAKAGVPVYTYYFSKQNGRLGPWHSGEEVYLYGNIPKDSKLYDAADRDLMRAFSGALLNFVKTGDPNGDGLTWNENKDSDTLLEFGGDGVRKIREKARKRELFGILDRLQGFPE